MSFFGYRFTPRRPDFMHTATDEENAVMRAHIEYWTELARQGTAIVFGPVLDPAGVWGVAVIEVDTEAQAQAIRAADPVVIADLGPVDVLPMAVAISRDRL